MQHRPRLATYSFALKLALALLAPLSLTTLCAQAAPATAAADAKSRIDIPAEDLGKALRDLGLQANYNISYDPTTVANLHATALKGDFTIDEALSRLLAGTQLRAVNINENTIQIVTAALASTADDGQSPGLEEIIVTGTNISGVENKTIPLLTFDKDAIERSGYATLADFITALPQNVKSGNNSADGILAGGNGYLNNLENSTAANLRGLGASSTLTLINGHRVAPAAFGTGVDLSMIPLSAVERVDVLTDGSSAVYGSDAVGGVVNVLLRKDFDGQETRVRSRYLEPRWRRAQADWPVHRQDMERRRRSRGFPIRGLERDSRGPTQFHPESCATHRRSAQCKTLFRRTQRASRSRLLAGSLPRRLTRARRRRTSPFFRRITNPDTNHR